VLLQFLVEAMSLSAMGGLIGVALGAIVGTIAGQKLGWGFTFRPDIVTVSMGFSALVGVVFGLYPAWKASQLDPIDALRYE
jgi:putative ABC transport system permease protein